MSEENEETTVPTEKPAKKATKKPQDRKKPQGAKITVEFNEQKYEFVKKQVSDARVIRLVEKGQIFAALEKILSEKDVDRLLDSIEDDDGHTDMDRVGEFFEEVFEAGDSGN